MVDKVRAVELRKQGLTYDEIAEHLGCSFSWCASNLREVEKGSGNVYKAREDATKEGIIRVLKDALAKLEGL